MQDEPINYPFIVGAYEAIISSLAYNLISKGVVDHDKYDMIKKYCEDEIVRVCKKEREYSTGTTV
jgi:hypothetical protein